MTKKYAVFSGDVQSQRDGDWHFIGNMELCRLYGVDPQECVMVDKKCYSQEYIESLIPLRPNYFGDYSLPSHLPPLQ